MTVKLDLASTALSEFNIDDEYSVFDSAEVGIWLCDEHGDAWKLDHGTGLRVVRSNRANATEDSFSKHPGVKPPKRTIASSVVFEDKRGRKTALVRQPFLTRHFKKLNDHSQ